MHSSIYEISLPNLLVAFVLVGVVLAVYAQWGMSLRSLLYGTARMFIQLMGIGFVLVYLFEMNSPWIMGSVLAAMLLIASWISMRPINKKVPGLYKRALLSLSVGCIITLITILIGVIELTPWHQPRYLLTIAGMIFANAMNTVSLAAERFYSEHARGMSYPEARNESFRAAMLPITNNFFAVGLVSIPGMMAGQVLAGISPLIAARYQIMVMCMLFSASGISAAVYLKLSQPTATENIRT